MDNQSKISINGIKFKSTLKQKIVYKQLFNTNLIYILLFIPIPRNLRNNSKNMKIDLSYKNVKLFYKSNTIQYIIQKYIISYLKTNKKRINVFKNNFN